MVGRLPTQTGASNLVVIFYVLLSFTPASNPSADPIAPTFQTDSKFGYFSPPPGLLSYLLPGLLKPPVFSLLLFYALFTTQWLE